MNTSNNFKKVLYIVIAALLVAGAIFAISKDRNAKLPGDYSISEIKQLAEDKQKPAFEALIKDLESRAKTVIKGEGDNADKTYDSVRHRIYIKIAEAQLELGNFQQALDALGNVPESQKTNPQVYQAYALAYKGLGQKDKAFEGIKQALAEDNSNVEMWLLYVELSTDLPNDQLSALYRQAIPATKSNKDIMISYAKFSERIGDKATAIAAWETALNGDPANASTYEAEIARLRQ